MVKPSNKKPVKKLPPPTLNMGADEALKKALNTRLPKKEKKGK
jgi:hypothetical protein